LNTVLVTGANGFIGRALCTRSLAAGWHVRGIIRPDSHIVRLPKGVETFKIESIGPDTEWSTALKSIDTVVHLAARVHMMNDSAADPLEEYRKVNVAGTEKLAKTAANAGIRRFIFMSSVKVNGEGKPSSYTETDSPSPTDPYGVSKWEAEQILNDIAAQTGMEVVTLRAPLVYGPNVKANFLNLIKIVQHGIPLPVGNINNRRSFIYLGNLIYAIVACVQYTGTLGPTYLISDGEDVSTTDLIKRIAHALERPARVFPFPSFLLRLAAKILGKGTAIDRLLDSHTINMSKIQHELKWKPLYSMEQGLKETARWYKQSMLSLN